MMKTKTLIKRKRELSRKVKVEIKEDLKHCLIFGLKARLPIAIVLEFVGYREEVWPLLQIISHGTRAYIWNAVGLKGFVVNFEGIMTILK